MDIEEIEIKCTHHVYDFINCCKPHKCGNCNLLQVVRNTYADKLKAENARLREALEDIASRNNVAEHGAAVISADIARKALSPLNEEGSHE